MPEPDPEDDARRLDALEHRLKAARPVEAPHQESHYSQASLAWRMVIELVAGLGIGFGIGYGIDWALGTMPIFLVIFIFLGLAAGIRTMLRSAREVETKRVAEAARAAAPRAPGTTGAPAAPGTTAAPPAPGTED